MLRNSNFIIYIYLLFVLYNFIWNELSHGYYLFGKNDIKMILKKDCFASRQYKGQYRYYRYKEKFYFEKVKMKNKLVFLRTHYPNNYSNKLNTGFT